jgi:adenylylsulfate kinase
MAYTKPENVLWHNGKITAEDRSRILGQSGKVIWFTGLSGSGKSTIAVDVERELIRQGKLAYRLDGDNIRHGLNADLGFSDADRDENIRRIAEVAALFKDAGIITLVSFISPFRRMRQFARERAGKDSFIEIYVKASLETCRARDPKGLYQKARQGEVAEFTGISSPYEPPENPEIILHTESMSVPESVKTVIEYLTVNK